MKYVENDCCGGPCPAPSPPPAPEPPQHVGEGLRSGQDLLENQYIESSNGQYRAEMQLDGNFVLRRGDYVVWTSNSYNPGQGPYRLAMQEDGNLVLYGAVEARVYWQSNTRGANRLALQDDGNLVIYGDRSTPRWSSGTAQDQGNVLSAGAELIQTQFIVSNNGQYRAEMQGDGNFALYWGVYSVWTSNSYHPGQGPYRLDMQDDGNLVLYGSGGRVFWSSNTRGANRLVLQDDGNLVIYNDRGLTQWSSRTARNQGPVLAAGQQLVQTQYLASNNGRYTCMMQVDGNLVVKEDQRMIWAADSFGKGRDPYRVALHSDGNLVVYDRTNQPMWQSNTRGNSRLVMEDDGRLVIYDQNNRQMWVNGRSQ